MLEEGSTRLVASIKNREFDEVDVAEVLVTAANSKLTVLQKQLFESNENLNQLQKKQETMK